MPCPNILLIMADQYEPGALSCADHPVVRTPNLDRLAQSGVRFPRAYCPSPVCGPCRVSMFTGLFPRAHGANPNWVPRRPGLPLLPEILRDAGYHTALVGKLHVSPCTEDHGFVHRRLHEAPYACYCPDEPRNSAYMRWLADRRFGGDLEAAIAPFDADETCLREDLKRFVLGSDWRTEDEHSNTWIGDETCAYLREHHREPFFAYASFMGPHQPMAAPGRWATMYDPREVPLPPEYGLDPTGRPILAKSGCHRIFRDQPLGDDEFRYLLARYYGQISMIDHQVGRILDTLEAEGLADNTMVVFMADHGDHAGQFGGLFKGTMYTNSVRVPLICRLPGAAAGRVCERTVGTVGLWGTLLDVAGLERPTLSAARSWLSLVRDPAAAWEDEAYSEFLCGEGELNMVTDGRHKLIRWRRDPEVLHELYDEDGHPYDAVNRFADPTVRTVRDRLVARLDELEVAARERP